MPRHPTTGVAPVGNLTPTMTPVKHRELEVVHIRDTNLYEIRYIGGGPVPSPLRGMYTRRVTAREAIEKFKQDNA